MIKKYIFFSPFFPSNKHNDSKILEVLKRAPTSSLGGETSGGSDSFFRWYQCVMLNENKNTN